MSRSPLRLSFLRLLTRCCARCKSRMIYQGRCTKMKRCFPLLLWEPRVTLPGRRSSPHSSPSTTRAFCQSTCRLWATLAASQLQRSSGRRSTARWAVELMLGVPNFTAGACMPLGRRSSACLALTTSVRSAPEHVLQCAGLTAEHTWTLSSRTFRMCLASTMRRRAIRICTSSSESG